MKERFALGFGNNVDYELVWDAAVLERLAAEHDVREEELDRPGGVDSERDLVVSILHFMRSGRGGERFVASSTVVEEFAEYFEKRITLGGTGVRAAIAMSRIGFSSVLHLVTMNDAVRALLPPGSEFVCSNDRETVFPHLIVQFERGAIVEANGFKIVARQSNRAIFHSDRDNIEMKLSAAFPVAACSANTLLISGFNAMQSESMLADRLRSIGELVGDLEEIAHVYYEDAGYYSGHLRSLVLRTLRDRIDVVGMNEDELGDHFGRHVDIADPVEVLDAMREVHARLGVPLVLVHCRSWAAAYGDRSVAYREALTSGVAMATTRFRHGDDYAAADYWAMRALPASEEGVAFAGMINHAGQGKICCVPVPDVAQAAGVTIGLGDAFVGGFLPFLPQQGPRGGRRRPEGDAAQPPPTPNR
jgi:ADP-dependent phosphofructokinase/glucokinase